MRRGLSHLAWLLLLLGGGLTWSVSTGLLNPVHPPDLTILPAELGAFRTLEVYDVDASLLGDLPPDRYTFRRVADGAGHEANLYLAYYNRGRRWSGRPHDLPLCYRAAGWTPAGSEVLHTPSGARCEAQNFRLGERQIRVFYWVQQPGLQPGDESAQGYLRRMFKSDRLRQDMASAYLEFPAAAAPADADALLAVQALMSALDGLWSPPAGS